MSNIIAYVKGQALEILDFLLNLGRFQPKNFSIH